VKYGKDKAMLSERKMKDLAHAALAASRADQTKVVLMARRGGLTRFANSAIHQNVSEENVKIQVRCVVGKRVGRVFANGASPEVMKDSVKRCYELTRHLEENPDFVSLPGPPSRPFKPINAYDPECAAATPKRRAEIVLEMIRIADPKGVNLFGAFWTEEFILAVANSLGVFAYHHMTAASLKVVSSLRGLTGYAEEGSIKLAEINPLALVREAIKSCQNHGEPLALPPGDYEVIMEPY